MQVKMLCHDIFPFSSTGATRDIGTALTRICLRHRAVEVKVKTFAR